jgi:hypothetical protein
MERKREGRRGKEEEGGTEGEDGEFLKDRVRRI